MLGLAVTWRAVEEDAPRWGDSEALEELRIDQGQKDHLLQGLDVVLEAPDLVEAHGGVHLQASTAGPTRRGPELVITVCQCQTSLYDYGAEPRLAGRLSLKPPHLY